MSLVWRKIQRSNKKAAKYKFVCQLQELTIHCGRKWQPQKVAVAWVHRRRRFVTKDHQWEPSITDPYRGIIVWPVEESECLEIVTTLYRDSRQETFDDKEWTFILEGVSSRGKRKALAGLSLNLRLFVNELPGTQTELQLKLKPMCDHVNVATMKLILSCQMLKEGNALDDDMQSVASAMSVSHQKADIADLTEFETGSPGELTQPMSGLTCSTPRASLDDSQQKSLPAEITSVTSEIAEAWRSTDLPKPSPPPPPSPPLADLSPVSIAKGKQDESYAPLPQKARRSPANVDKSNYPKTAPQRESTAELPPVGSDLLSWCQAVTRGYRGVNVVDFSRCWRNGLAFCALIHRFRPDLIGNFDSLRPDDVRSNCKLAFDAAASLGVPKLIDPEEMVIMVVPDKIAITSYVYNLRAALTGQSSGSAMVAAQQRHSFASSPWSLLTSRTDDSASQEHATLGVELPTTDDWKEAVGNVKPPQSTVAAEMPVSPSEQKSLMTRNQLMNPFDSDGEDAGNVVSPSAPKDTDVASPSAQAPSFQGPADGAPATVATFNGGGTREVASNVEPRPSSLMPTSSVKAGDRQEDLKRRARMLLQQFQTDDNRLTNDVLLSPEDERRRQELKERARQLIEEAQRRPPNVLKISEMISVDNDELSPTRQNRIKQPSSSSEPTTRQTSPEHRQYIARPLVTKESLKDAVQQVESGAFDRFKRFGSMRTQELTQSINVLSSRFLHQRAGRSASVPKELQRRARSSSSFNTVETCGSPVKTDDALERDTRKREEILAEIEQLTQRQRILDQNAADVEKRWRKAMQDASGTELEQSLMNEYLSLLNERNMLTRRDMYLNILEKIRDREERFQNVQRQLGDMMKVEESEKTEIHKRQIDVLMEKLIEIVNQRDELVQQLMAHEQGTQEAAELAEDMINHSLPLANEDQKNCVIQ